MLLKLIAGLGTRESRYEAAIRLASQLNCSHLIIFVDDPVIGVLLPAPGFPQTLPDGKAWQSFLREVIAKGYHCGSLPFKSADLLSAAGIAGPGNSAAVLLGGAPAEEELEPLKDMLPVLVALFRQEQASISSETRVLLAERSAAKAEGLARTIDLMREQLKNALIDQKQGKRDIEDLMNKKDEFMNVASHELKTPITSMRAYLQILNRLIPEEENYIANDIIQKANLQAGHLTQLINDLLDVSKIHAGQMDYHFADIELSEMIRDVVEQVQMTETTHRIIVTENTRALVHGERQRLEQVLHNFLSNAIKYSPDADKVVVSSYLEGNQVKVCVKDYGIGLSEEVIPFVFDRFFRVRETSRQFSGLGLGLFICSEIIKRHSGHVGAMSSTLGTEFFFQLPIVDKQID